MNINDVYFGVLGGSLIGISAIGLMLTLGRIAGISGIIQAALWSDDKSWRLFFLFGLIASCSLFYYFNPEHIVQRQGFPLGWLGFSGLLVGLGVALGNGCTSGHGICGLSRFSKRSLVATLVFFALALITRYFFHTVLEILP
jgi:hypothetical protein